LKAAADETGFTLFSGHLLRLAAQEPVSRLNSHSGVYISEHLMNWSENEKWDIKKQVFSFFLILYPKKQLYIIYGKYTPMFTFNSQKNIFRIINLIFS